MRNRRIYCAFYVNRGETAASAKRESGSLSTDVFEPRTSTGSLCFSFSTFSCPTNELPSSHFNIYNLIFSTKSELYAPKRRSFDFRLTFVAQKRLCLSSLILAMDPPGIYPILVITTVTTLQAWKRGCVN